MRVTYLAQVYLYMVAQSLGAHNGHTLHNGCRCDGLTITDEQGTISGNCTSAYNGVLWCYLPDEYSDCQDRRDSTTILGRQWSHEACASQGISTKSSHDLAEKESSGCHCDILTTYDKYGRVKGNCLSNYKGHPWCYLPKTSQSSCTDAVPSKTVRGRQWSHQACSEQVETKSVIRAGTRRQACKCQCDSFTFKDKNGQTRGGCLSNYKGSPWCFLPKSCHNSCSDARVSTKVQGRQWSHQACSLSNKGILKSQAPPESNKCVCDNLTVNDKYGNVKGNCQGCYKGAAWCFLPQTGLSACKDEKASNMLKGRRWSFEACDNLHRSAANDTSLPSVDPCVPKLDNSPSVPAIHPRIPPIQNENPEPPIGINSKKVVDVIVLKQTELEQIE